MAYPPRLQLDKGYYHIIQRGNARQAIFDGGRDNKAFLERLRKAAHIFEIRFHAYCLMGNHGFSGRRRTGSASRARP